jgi:molybdenum cofactor guanylyltransferase
MLDVEGFILVGGASRRMGEDKSRLLVNGRTTVTWVTEALRPVTSSVSLVGSHAEPNSTSLPNIPDLQSRWGPLAGIQAALRACKTECCIIAACDLPFVTPGLFAHLLTSMEAAKASAEAMVPMQSDGRAQPLCSVYRRAPCLAAAEESIANNEHSPRAMLDMVRTQYISFDELAKLPGSEYFFFNVNRREDYERAKQIAVNIRSTR